MYSDSDDDYDDNGYYTYRAHSKEDWPPLRLYQAEEYRLKNDLHRRITADGPMSVGGHTFSEKVMMRTCAELPNMPAWDNWRPWRVMRFFGEIEGFYKGDLDLSGRTRARHDELIKKMYDLTNDVHSLVPHVTYVEEEHEGIDLETGKLVKEVYSVPVIDDAKLWDEFRAKWRTPPALNFAMLRDFLIQTFRAMRKSAGAKFQELFITDLPPEIIMMVFSYLTVEQARALSAACHYFRDVGLTYIYTTRKLMMKSPMSGDLGQIVTTADAGQMKEQAHALLAASRDKCIREIEFLLSRPDIRARVRSVTVGDTWSSALSTDIKIGDAVSEARVSWKYSNAIVDKFTTLLPQLMIKSLTLHRLMIDVNLAACISQHPTVRNLEVQHCNTAPSLWDHILASQPGSLQSPIESLVLYLHQGDDGEDVSLMFSAWNVFALCPSLRLLRVVVDEFRTGFDMPDRMFWPYMTCLANLEYLDLHGLFYGHISDLVDWFAQSVAVTGSLRLTHLKIRVGYGIPDALAGQLLQALHTGHAPLRVLALDGIFGTDASLFDTLGQLFPSLEGLTLVRRTDEAESSPALCQWPLPMYEYAAHMQSLTRLRHFGANFLWIANTVSPAVLRRLEPDYVPEDDPGRFDWDFMEDGYSLALPFAACCPALQTFAITADYLVYTARISRSATGTIEIESLRPQIRDPEFDQWNPVPWSQSVWRLPENEVKSKSEDMMQKSKSEDMMQLES